MTRAFTTPTFLRTGGAAVACALALAACGGSGGGDVALAKTGVALFSSAAGTVSLAAGSSVSHTIGGGGGGAATTTYTATSNNLAAATVSVTGNKLAVAGVAPGNATISVQDSSGSGQSLLIPVTVTAAAGSAAAPPPFFSTAQSALTISAGAAPAYLIKGGNAPYTVSTNNAGVATASVSGTSLVITAVAPGSATIAAFDASGSMLSFAVTVPGAGSSTPLYSTAQSAISVATGASPSYQVAGGVAPYTSASSNADVATASISGNALTIHALASGSASIALFDASGTSTRIAVTVAPSIAGPALYTTSPSPLTLAPGAISYRYNVAGGKGPYTVATSNASVAEANVTGDVLRIMGVAGGTANVVVYDALGATATTAVVVSGSSGSTPLYTTAQRAIIVGAGSSTSYSVGGGAGSYSATTDDATTATVSLTGNLLTINGISTGFANIVIADALRATTTISVQVGSSKALYTTAPTSVSIAAGAAPEYQIRGGVAPYVITSSAVGIATATGSGDILTITGVAAGTATVNVLDSAGALVSISVTVP